MRYNWFIKTFYEMVNILTIPEYNLLITKINSHVNSWSDISYDSFSEILQYIPYFQYNKLAQVCTSFRNHLKREDFWKQVCLQHFNITHLHTFPSYFEIYQRMGIFLNLGRPISFEGQVEFFRFNPKSNMGTFNIKGLSSWFIDFSKDNTCLALKGSIIKDLKTSANFCTSYYVFRDESREYVNIDHTTYSVTIDLKQFAIYLSNFGEIFRLQMYGWRKRVPLSLLPPKSSCIIS